MDGQEDLTSRLKIYTKFLDEKLRTNYEKIRLCADLIRKYKGTGGEELLEFSLIFGSVQVSLKYGEAYAEAREHFYDIFPELKPE